ncbi:MAG: CatB-related O-acetyltransferase [Acidobacteriota bacterium]
MLKILIGIQSKLVRALANIGLIKPYTRYDPKFKRYKIGEYTYGYPRILDWTKKIDCSIGRYCSIASEVTIILDGNHITSRISTYPPELIDSDIIDSQHPAGRGPIKIGNDVWIGYGVTILPGVEICDGAVLAAGAVISRDVPAFAVAAGNPARIIKYRFNEETRAKILASKWWERQPSKEVAKYIMQDAEEASYGI